MRSLVLTCLILIVGVTLALFVKHWTDAHGLPVIVSNVDKQLVDLVSQSPNLKGLIVGKRTSVLRMVGDAPPFEGEIQYQAQLNGSSVDLFVYWAGDSTNSQITKIESALNNSEPQILWEQH